MANISINERKVPVSCSIKVKDLRYLEKERINLTALINLVIEKLQNNEEMFSLREIKEEAIVKEEVSLIE